MIIYILPLIVIFGIITGEVIIYERRIVSYT